MRILSLLIVLGGYALGTIATLMAVATVLRAIARSITQPGFAGGFLAAIVTYGFYQVGVRWRRHKEV